MPQFAPEECTFPLLQKAPRILGFDPEAFFPEWRSALRRTFTQLLGLMPALPASLADLQVRIEDDHTTAEFREIRYLFTAEPNCDVPCHLLLPLTPPPAAGHPLVICLQGHSTGMHISLGRAKYPGDEKSIEGDRDFGLQAVRQGYAALVLEQRGFGERRDQRPSPQRLKSTHNCHHATMTALLLGRTMIGQRAWDVARAIDTLETFPQIDRQRLACMGNSGGGTTTYYAAAFDPRIKIAMPSCAVCTYADSIGAIDHCMDNYLPGIMHYMDMADVAALIFPRPLVVVAGAEDHIFPLGGVREACGIIEQIYREGAKHNPEAGSCRLVVGPGGHRFYADLAWPTFREVSGW